MIRVRLIISIFFFTVLSNLLLSQNIEIKGKFEHNQIIENFIGTGQQKAEFIDLLNKLNEKKVKTYIRLVSQGKYEKAKKAIQNDSLLKIQDSRRIITLYCCYIMYKNNLLDYSILNMDDFENGTINIFLTKEQLEKIKPNLDKEIVFRVC